MKLLFLVLIAMIASVHAHNNGLARTPPMGFNTWNQFGCGIDEAMVKKTIDTIVSSGLRDLGYRYVNIDDCWAMHERDPNTKRMIPDVKRFRNGMKALAQYAHSKQMYLGIYSDLGTLTCAGYPGSYGYYDIDAQTFADWEIDYLKFDFCHTVKEQADQPWIDYTAMSVALNKTGRPIVYSICNWGVQKPWEWAPKIANLWRTTSDIQPYWASVMVILDQNKPLFRYSGPGNWNDPDMLEVGVKRSTMLTPVEARSHFSFWALLSAPLLLGNDLRDLASIEPWVMDIITNRDVIAVNQDPAGLQGFPVEENVKGVNLTNGNCTSSEPRSCVRTETWIKPLSNNRFAVILFNRGGIALNDDHFSNEVMTLDWQKHLKVDPANRYYIKDLWNHKYVGVVSKQFTPEQFIAPHDLVMLTLTPVE